MSADLKPTPSVYRHNPVLICLFHALQMSLFPMATISLFWRSVIGLNMRLIMMLQAVFGAIVALCEFPSGYLADRIGYRRTLVLSSTLLMCGWVIYLKAQHFAHAVFAESALAVGYALASGTDSALMYESLKALGKEHDFTCWYGRFQFSGQVAEGSAALFAGLLYRRWRRLPILLQSVTAAFNILVVSFTREPPRQTSADSDSHWSHIRRLIVVTLRENTELRDLIILSVIFGLSSFVPVWTIQLYAQQSGVPVTWLGPIWSIANLCVGLGALMSHRISRKIGSQFTLLSCIVLILCGYGGLGLFTHHLAFSFYFLITLMRGINGPLLAHQQHRLIPSSDRASTISLRSLIFRAGFVVIGPICGFSIDAVGQHVTMFALGLMFSAAAYAMYSRLKTYGTQ